MTRNILDLLVAKTFRDVSNFITKLEKLLVTHLIRVWLAHCCQANREDISSIDYLVVGSPIIFHGSHFFAFF